MYFLQFQSIKESWHSPLKHQYLFSKLQNTTSQKRQIFVIIYYGVFLIKKKISVHKHNCNNKFTNCYHSQNTRTSNVKNVKFTSTTLCVLTHRLNLTYQQDGCIVKLFAILYTFTTSWYFHQTSWFKFLVHTTFL
jgi:hypothetical protein